MGDEILYSCRRSRCTPDGSRQKLPPYMLVRNDSGDLVCKPGMCPNNAGSNDAILDLQMEVRRLTEKNQNCKIERDRALSKVESLQSQLQAALDIRDVDGVVAITEGADSGFDSTSVPILLCSDWHCGAVVHGASINELNEYNVDIFHDRVAALFRNALKVVRMVRSSVTVREMVLWLGGDLIDNWLHPEQAQTQELSPIQQTIECERAIVAGIDYLLEHGDFERIIVPCNFGNHGRTTPKMQADNAHATSYEWLMYQSLRRHYREQSRVEWMISDGNILYYDVMGHRLRFHHGDAIKYGGGIGGLPIPLQKWVHRQDTGIKADHSFFGHFHQLTLGNGWSVNGSLIGATAYGLKLGFSPERPQQLMRFIDSKRGFTVSAPVLAT
jgi:hypothetical protein